jgi:geranylgeranylglycerol-phosphate geranylgeranyltransferase
LWAHVRLGRPSDTGLAVIGTVVGAGLAGVPDLWSWRTAVVAASNACLSGGSMMFNDWHDVDEDRVNRPDRPIPSGAVPRSRGLWMGLLALALGVGLGLAAGSRFGVMAACVALLSITYTLSLKRWPFAGNLMTAALSSYTLWCWVFESPAGHPLYLYILGAYFVGTVGKEVARTAADLPGDSAAGIRTAATILGARGANRFGLALIACGMALVWLPILQRSGGATYTTVLIAATTIGAAVLLRKLALGPAPSARDTSRLVVSVTRAITVAIVLSVVWDLVLTGRPG